jgi:cytochrome b6-f complex iron-sulfur subunit
VDWQADKKLFVCPCHDSEFSPNGKVVKDPAEQDLPLYQAKIEGDTVWVKV